MNSELKEKEINKSNDKEIELFLSSEQCINAGIVLISIFRVKFPLEGRIFIFL